MRRVEKLPAALNDLVDLAIYIADDSPTAAERFLLNAEATFRDLAEHPGLGHRRDDLDPPFNELGCRAVRGFRNHLAFYRSSPEVIVIVRVVHGMRDLRSIEFES